MPYNCYLDNNKSRLCIATENIGYLDNNKSRLCIATENIGIFQSIRSFLMGIIIMLCNSMLLHLRKGVDMVFVITKTALSYC